MLGYRPREVEGAIASLESELGRSSESLRAREAEARRHELEVEELRSIITRRDDETARLRAELIEARELAAQQLEGLAFVGRQLGELRAAARGQATRLRLRALREAALLSSAATEACANPEIRGERHERLLAALDDAIARVATDWEPDDLAADTAPANEAVEAVRAGARAERTSVSVDIGPFADFSQLVRFEDAANAIGATGDISIKRFSEGRARIDVALSEPIDLLRELEERCDLEFKVRSAADDEIVLDVDGE